MSLVPTMPYQYTFYTYQSQAVRTMRNNEASRDNLINGALGLAGEAGEAVDLLKKHLCHDHPLDTAKLAKELGDVLWYLSEIAHCTGLQLGDCAMGNIAKLKERYPDGFSVERSLNRKENTNADG